MAPPWAETPSRVVIEFKRSAAGLRRVISLSHSPAFMPVQLQGRIDPGAWGALVSELQVLAEDHPWVRSADSRAALKNLLGCLIGFWVGICCFDSGHDNGWSSDLHAIVDRHRPGFPGCELSVRTVQGTTWVQIDVSAGYGTHGPAYGLPAAVPPPSQPMYGMPPAAAGYGFQPPPQAAAAYGVPQAGTGYGNQMPPSAAGYGMPPPKY